MTIAITASDRARITETVLDLAKDLDIPVYVEGDIYHGVRSDQGDDARDMPPEDAARIVVDVVLDHPIVQDQLAFTGDLWDALLWAVTELHAHNVPSSPRLVSIVGTAREVVAINWNRFDLDS